jgi:D-threo-aldose 1-dehydrogenase
MIRGRATILRVNDLRGLGSSRVQVSVLGFGGAPIGNLYAPTSDAQAVDAVAAAYDVGIRYFDTAPYYGHGLSERRMGDALRRRGREDYVLSTKVGRTLIPEAPERIEPGQFFQALPFRPQFDYSYDGVMRSMEDSLQRLGLHRIDVLLIHDVDAWTHKSPEATARRFREVMEGGYRALTKLRSEGVVGAIGCGLNEWQACERFAEAGDFDCFLLAGRYTLLEQESLDSLLPLCAKRRISIIIGGPYNTGILATGAVDGAYYNYAVAPPVVMKRVRRIEDVCRRHGVALATAALRFPLCHPAVACVIPGARSAAEVRCNVELFEAPVPDDLWSNLKREGLLRQDAPTPG